MATKNAIVQPVVKAKDLAVKQGKDVKGAIKGAVQRGGCDDFGCGQTNHNETLLRG
jgi:hypothetical protein